MYAAGLVAFAPASTGRGLCGNIEGLAGGQWRPRAFKSSNQASQKVARCCTIQTSPRGTRFAPGDWTFKAHKPPGPHPNAAYFTTLPPDTRNLANRLRIPASKIDYVFCFIDVGDLTPLPGDRGSYIFFFRGDYVVTKQRQEDCGAREEAKCK